MNALLLDPKDNVVTCVKEVRASEDVVWQDVNGFVCIQAMEEIPYCHKVALIDLREGDTVIKYGEMIGKTTHPIGKGCRVDENNIVSVPRDYDSELV